MASKACSVLSEHTKMERWAEAAGDQMEESLVMGCVGLYNENDPWNGTALLRMMRAKS